MSSMRARRRRSLCLPVFVSKISKRACHALDARTEERRVSRKRHHEIMVRALELENPIAPNGMHGSRVWRTPQVSSVRIYADVDAEIVNYKASMGSMLCLRARASAEEKTPLMLLYNAQKCTLEVAHMPTNAKLPLYPNCAVYEPEKYSECTPTSPLLVSTLCIGGLSDFPITMKVAADARCIHINADGSSAVTVRGDPLFGDATDSVCITAHDKSTVRWYAGERTKKAPLKYLLLASDGTANITVDTAISASSVYCSALEFSSVVGVPVPMDERGMQARRDATAEIRFSKSGAGSAADVYTIDCETDDSV
jgi:hypothetical protein